MTVFSAIKIARLLAPIWNVLAPIPDDMRLKNDLISLVGLAKETPTPDSMLRLRVSACERVRETLQQTLSIHMRAPNGAGI